MAKYLEDIWDNDIVNNTIVWVKGSAAKAPQDRDKAVKLPAVRELYDYATFARDLVKTMREQAIEKGFAQYNPKTGDWEWSDEV